MRVLHRYVDAAATAWLPYVLGQNAIGSVDDAPTAPRHTRRADKTDKCSDIPCRGVYDRNRAVVESQVETSKAVRGIFVDERIVYRRDRIGITSRLRAKGKRRSGQLCRLYECVMGRSKICSA